MADEEKGCYRATGALDNLIETMRSKLADEGRSPAYCEAFWSNFGSYCAELGKGH